MITGTSQVKEIGNGIVAYIPYGIDDQEDAKNLKENRIVKHKITTLSAEKERSVTQLNLLMAACQYFADNTENPHWNTKDKVKFQLKVATDFRDPDTVIVDPKGNIHFHYRSFSFDTLKHMEACRIFERCYEILADGLGMTVQDLVRAVKEGMRSY